MSRILRSTDIAAACRARQRGFLLNPFRFGGAVTGQSVVQSGSDNFGGTSATATVNLTSVTAGNRIEVRVCAWGYNTQPDCTVADNSGTNSYTLGVRAQRTAAFDKNNAEMHYVFSAVAGSYTVTVTHPSNSGNRSGHIWVGEISGGAALISGASGTNTGTGTACSVTGAGATGGASMVGAACTVSGSTTGGIDATTGNSLSWNSRLLVQAMDDIAASINDAASASSITPAPNFGTLDAGTTSWSAVTWAFANA